MFFIPGEKIGEVQDLSSKYPLITNAKVTKMKNCLFYKLFVLFIISMVIFLNPIFAQETDNFIKEYNSLSDSW